MSEYDDDDYHDIYTTYNRPPTIDILHIATMTTGINIIQESKNNARITSPHKKTISKLLYYHKYNSSFDTE